jgi:hypothetical protein
MRSTCPGLDQRTLLQTPASSATKTMLVLCVHLNMVTKIFAHLDEPVSVHRIPHANCSPGPRHADTLVPCVLLCVRGSDPRGHVLVCSAR